MNMITDFGIFAIPILPVLRLQMPRRRKLHLLGVFCLGFLYVIETWALVDVFNDPSSACAISIVRLNELHRTKGSKDPLWDSAATAYWSAIELNVGILCACLPTLRPLIKKFAPRLLGSSQGESHYTHQLGSVQTRRTRIGNEAAIYIQKEVEFQSTTELRSKEVMKDPFSIREESLDEIISERRTAQAKWRKVVIYGRFILNIPFMIIFKSL